MGTQENKNLLGFVKAEYSLELLVWFRLQKISGANKFQVKFFEELFTLRGLCISLNSSKRKKVKYGILNSNTHSRLPLFKKG